MRHQRIDVIALGLTVEQRHQFLQLGRVGRGEIMRLAVIFCQVVQLPGMVADWRGFPFFGEAFPGKQMAGAGPPAIFINAAIADHFKKLHVVRGGCLGIGEACGKAMAFQR